MSGLYPSPPDLPEAGRGGENALGVTQIYWDFESCVLRNVGKDEGVALGYHRSPLWACGCRREGSPVRYGAPSGTYE